MFEDYKMLRSDGISPVGAALMSVYLLVVVGPLLMFSDWYGKKHVGEYIDDDDFPLETTDSTIPQDNLINCPPIGSKEWDDWIEKMERKDLE